MAKTYVQHLAEVVAKKHNLSLKDAEEFVAAVFSIAHDGLEEDKQVKIKGLGTFSVKAVKARESVNVNTGERVTIESHEKVSFTPDKVMAELVNKPFAQFETVVLNDGVEFDDETPQKEQKEDTVEQEVASKEEPKESIVQETTPSPAIPESAEKSDSTEPSDTLAEEPEEHAAEEFEATPSPDARESTETLESSEPSDPGTEEPEETAAEEPVEAPSPDISEPSKEQDSPKPSDSGTAEQEETPTEETDDSTSTKQTEPSSSHRRIWVLIILGLLIVAAVVGYFYYNIEQDRKPLPPLPKEMVEGKHSSVPVKAKPQAVDSTALLLEKANNDPRVRAGAYNVVGIDTIVTLRTSQTMHSYCKHTLGELMIVYFQALNGKDSMSAGERMMVPKVRYKSRK